MKFLVKFNDFMLFNLIAIEVETSFKKKKQQTLESKKQAKIIITKTNIF